MTPIIINIEEKKLIGMRMKMSWANYQIAELWKTFMPRRNEISNKLSADLFSLAIYKPNHFENFSPNNEFERWAAYEVENLDALPNEMEYMIITAGLYAVFNYKGLHTDNSIFQYIFNKWLPSSEYTLDNRPHFEVLGAKYKNNDPTSEEEIWIPIKQKE